MISPLEVLSPTRFEAPCPKTIYALAVLPSLVSPARFYATCLKSLASSRALARFFAPGPTFPSLRFLKRRA